jgi:AcrR family transcriptional regulator
LSTQTPERKRKPAAASADRLQERDTPTVVRRAPFSDNPTVGARGQRTQQRILDAALRVFGDEGYHQCSIDRITKQAGCSRVSFYQYFGSKEDVFRHLAGQIARQIYSSTEALDPLTPDADGWASLRGWVTRYGDIYERYEPMFKAFDAAAERDEIVAGGGARTAARYIAGIRSHIATTTLPPRQLDPIITLAVECLTRTNYHARILRGVQPASYPRTRVENAVTDVMHRTLFGLQPDVNVHTPARRRPSPIPFDDALQKLLEQASHDLAAHDTNGTVKAFLEAGREVFVQRGYYGTRVDDIAAAAGLSHGAFYRYFGNKGDLVHALAVRAVVGLGNTLGELPAIGTDGAKGTAPLRRWLRRYNAAQSSEAAMMRVWVDATTQDASLGADSAPVVDWGRRRLARFLAPRGFGDVDIEAVVMVAFLDAFGAHRRSPGSVDGAVRLLERGLLGREPTS